MNVRSAMGKSDQQWVSVNIRSAMSKCEVRLAVGESDLQWICAKVRSAVRFCED